MNQIFGVILIICSVIFGIRAIILLLKMLADSPASKRPLSRDEKFHYGIAQPIQNRQFTLSVSICLILGFIGYALLLL